jgi:Tfp pilus assembly protein PilE
VKCHACKQDNAANALFCTACRRPLVAPTAPPSRIEPLATPSISAGAAAMAATPSGFAAERSAGSARDRYAPPNATGAGRADDDSGALTDEEAWDAVIGNSNNLYYLTRFERLSQGGSASWHWPAFFVTWYWMLYRKLWVATVVYMIAPWVALALLAALPSAAAGPLMVMGWLAYVILPPVMANKWYFKSCEKKIQDVRARGGSKEKMIARLESAGGTSNIIVIVLAFFGIIFGLGILSAVSLPAYQTYTIKAKIVDAIPVANDVAAAVGKQYEQTGALPSGDDVNRMLAEAPHHSRYVSGVELDGTSGMLKVKINVPPNISGTLLMLPAADNNRHLTWTCATDDLKRYVPASCRADVPAH